MSRRPKQSRTRKKREKAAKQRKQNRLSVPPPSKVFKLSGRIVDNVCAVPVLVAHPIDRSRTLRCSAIIDTGATRTTISEELWKQLDLPLVDVGRSHTANGTVPNAIVAAVVGVGDPLDGVRLMRVCVAANMNVPMLFGMDAIGGTLTVDTPRQMWRWDFRVGTPPMERFEAEFAEVVTPTAVAKRIIEKAGRPEHRRQT